MKITKLKATKKGDRVNVYLDGEFAFSIAGKFVSDFVLFRGEELDEDKIEEIKGKDLQDRYFQKVIKLIARRPRGEFEIQSYLKKKLYKRKDSDKIIAPLIDKLKKKNYVNDLEFAKWWVDNRIRFKPRGEFLIVKELKAKGIEKEIINKALKLQGLTKSKELEAALLLGKKKKRLLGSLKDKKNKEKFMRYLLAKGFDYSIIKKVLEKLTRT